MDTHKHTDTDTRTHTHAHTHTHTHKHMHKLTYLHMYINADLQIKYFISFHSISISGFITCPHFNHGYRIIHIVRGGKVSWLHDLLAIRGKAFAIV